MRWIDRQADSVRAARWEVVNRILARLVVAVWLAVLGYVAVLAWMG